MAQLQDLSVALCNALPLPPTREHLLSSESLPLRPPTRMLQYVFALLGALPPPKDPAAVHHAAMSFIPRLLPGTLEPSYSHSLALYLYFGSVYTSIRSLRKQLTKVDR